MTTASVDEMSAKFSAFLAQSEGSPVVVTEGGKPVAVLLGMTDEDEVERLVLSYSPEFRSILNSAKAEIEAGRGIPHDRFWGEVAAEAE